MSRTRSKRSASTRRTAGAGWRLPPSVWRGVWLGLGWSVALLALAYGMHRLERYVVARQAEAPLELVWVDQPEWLAADGSADARADIKAAATLPAGLGVHAAGLCAAVAEGLSKSAWVAEVQRVSKLPNGEVRVQARYREPFAFVERDGRVYRVDREGVRLPLPGSYHVDFIQDRFWNDWYRVVGTKGAMPEEGQPWEGGDIVAGLALIEFLSQSAARGEVPFRSSLRAIDVGQFGRRVKGDLRIRTIHPKGYIQWGLPPGGEYNVESTAARKLDMLRTEYLRRGSLPPTVLDVRDPRGIRVGPQTDG